MNFYEALEMMETPEMSNKEFLENIRIRGDFYQVIRSVVDEEDGGVIGCMGIHDDVNLTILEIRFKESTQIDFMHTMFMKRVTARWGMKWTLSFRVPENAIGNPVIVSLER